MRETMKVRWFDGSVELVKEGPSLWYLPLGERLGLAVVRADSGEWRAVIFTGESYNGEVSEINGGPAKDPDEAMCRLANTLVGSREFVQAIADRIIAAKEISDGSVN